MLNTVAAAGPLYPDVAQYVQQRVAELEQIPAARREELEQLSQYVGRCRSAGRPARLTFICTHNSRRSHFAQIWAQVAAAYYAIPQVETFSGGTEATAFNPRTIEALRRCGLQITVTDKAATNPRYAVRFQESGAALAGFSKIYNMPPNPTQAYCAVMTCSQADQACPTAAGCDQRIALPYDDPKVSDDTPQEAATYDARCAQIAREMLYVMSRVHQSSGF